MKTEVFIKVNFVWDSFMDSVDSSKMLDPTMKGSFNTDMFMEKELKLRKHLTHTQVSITKDGKKELEFCKK